jgi:anti-sigma regulatory factor (Ser/Thr protein kinase)
MSLHAEIGLPFRVNLAALPDAPGLARRFLAKLLGLWGIVGETADNALLLVSELATNATFATARGRGYGAPRPDEPAPIVIVRTRVTSDSLCVEVWDNNPNPPVVKHVDENSETGRGLLLVTEIADEWGWQPMVMPPRETPGKVVWFLLKLATPPQPQDASPEQVIVPDEVIVSPRQISKPALVPQPRPALPSTPPVRPSPLPHRVKQPSPALARRAVPPPPGNGRKWSTGPDTLAQLHAALLRLPPCSPQPTRDQQCANA